MTFIQRPEINNIYTAFLDKDVCKESLDYLKNIQDRINSNPYHCKCLTSDNLTNNILNDMRLQKLHFNILAHIQNYMTHQNAYYEGFIEKSWFNIYHKDFFQEYHLHMDAINRAICGIVYFSNSPKSMTKFYIHDPISITPEIGKIVLFPDHVEHRVVVNDEDKTRVSLAFNYRKCQLWKGMI